MKSGVALDPQQHPHRMELMLLLFYRPLICREDGGRDEINDDYFTDLCNNSQIPLFEVKSTQSISAHGTAEEASLGRRE